MPETLVVDFRLNTGNSIKEGEKVVKNVQKLKKGVKETSKETKELKTDVSELGGQLDTISGGAISKFKAFRGSVANVTKGFKTLKGAIISTGIGALVIVVAALVKNFTASEEGQNKLAKGLKTLGVIAGNIGDIFADLGELLVNVFTGNIDGIKESFNNLKSGINNFFDETKKEMELAGDLADRIAKANKQERDLLVERAKVNVEINKLKTKAAEVDKFTTEERIFFLRKAAELEDEITNKEVNLAKMRRDIKIEENALSKSTAEDLDEEARLKAEVIRLDEQRIVRNKELLGVAAGLELQQKAADEAALEARRKEIEGFKENALIMKDLKKGIDMEELEDLNVKNAAIMEGMVKMDETDRLLKEQARARAIEQDNATLGRIASLAGEGSAIGKAAALTQATIQGIAGVQNAYTTAQSSPITAVFPGYPIVQAALAAAFAAVQIKQILSVPKPSKTGGGARGTVSASGGGGGASPTPPAFNVVGASDSNQLAQTINEREERPIKAFVTSNDVTTAQSLDRNIVESASIG